MTREEAIRMIERIKDRINWEVVDSQKKMDALNVAITALEQKPCEDLINQRATTCRHGGHCEWVACDKCNHYEPDLLSQEPCEDCISRQAVIKLLSYDWAYRPAQKAVESIKNLPPVKPQEKTEQFAKWVATEIFDDMWKYNKDAFAEIACRKLAKLGIVRAKGDEWELVEPYDAVVVLEADKEA